GSRHAAHPGQLRRGAARGQARRRCSAGAPRRGSAGPRRSAGRRAARPRRGARPPEGVQSPGRAGRRVPLLRRARLRRDRCTDGRLADHRAPGLGSGPRLAPPRAGRRAPRSRRRCTPRPRRRGTARSGRRLARIRGSVTMKPTQPDPTAGRWARIEALFAEAVELPPAERSAVLERVEPDPTLRAEAGARRAAHEAPATGLLDGPPPWLRGRADPDLPDRIGPYRIERLLGRGGMGRVYLAEHEAADFRRQVAIKLVRRGLDTEDVLRRFRAERRILASLDHPNIARLLDVGATDDGLPYFVMEYVDGVDILEHCRRHALDIPARLAL